ncbi:MAG: AAA family ATPase [Candidatus Omnitrophica bacterium]|nr:AAA family ATPase [Candidatus Omnitrophota bacterium]
MRMNIALVGLMGTGKTTVAQILAARLTLPAVDLDALIEAREGMAITEIFQRRGEAYFRDIEARIVEEQSRRGGKIIACGGGVVLRPENLVHLRRQGVIVCLQARPEVILERTRGSSQRPLLNVPDPLETIRQLQQARQAYYAQADYTVDTSDSCPDRVVDAILQWCRERGDEQA